MQKSLNTQNHLFSKQPLEKLTNSWENKVKDSYKPRSDSISLSPSVLLGVFFLSAIFFIYVGCGSDKTKEKLDVVNERFEHLENKTDQLEAQFTEMNESLTTLGSYIISLEERIENLPKEIEKSPVPKQTVSQEEKHYHKVVRGDTLYSIARKYGLSVEKIRRINNLSDNKTIQPGQKLLVTPGSRK